MSYLLIDILLCILLYGILFAIILKNKWSSKPRDDQDDNDDGGIIDWTPPKIDLPPGVSLPGDPIFVRDKEDALIEQ
ncbi:MAG: hypothetical protein RIA69_07645 [Cyclobacteriaceae bacterium]